MARSGILVSLVYGAATLLVACGAAGYGPGEQAWGYIDVREGAHMFYWLYYTTANVSTYTDRPLVIWLQGGPGASSTGYGNFEELGPLDLDNNERDFTWVKDVNVLFIDNPVGSGFSYVDSSKYLTTDNKMIADDLVTLMKGFYKKHPEFKTVPLHIFCESYGGKMAAEFALELDRAIKKGEIESNLKSVGLGDSWIAPIVSVYSWAPLLLNMGIVDQDGYEAIMKSAVKTEKAINENKWSQATQLWGVTEMVLLQVSKGVDFYNILLPTSAQSTKSQVRLLAKDILGGMHNTLVRFDLRDNRDDLLEDLMRGEVSKALNIPANVTWGAQSQITFNALSGDFMKPVVHIVEQLLNETDLDVAVYTGQLDLICATPATVAWVDSMKWKSSGDYLTAPRNAMSVNGILEGYVKQTGKFSMYWVNRAGHMVPADNPAAMDYILRKMTKYNEDN